MSRLETFLAAHLEGGRFEQHTIPLDLLRDLSAIGDLVIEAAKWRYLQDHAGRTRVPKGFADSVYLSLSEIVPGSAVARIDLVVSSDELFGRAERWYELARDSILDAITAADQCMPVLKHLPDALLSYFNRIGRGLRDHEALVLGDRDGVRHARLTQQVRKKLVFATDQARQYTETVTLRGLVPEADQERQTFQMQLPDGQRVAADLDPAHEDIVLRAFNHYRGRMKIAIEGIGVVDKSGRLQRLESVDHVAELDPLDIAARIDELRLLTNGWLDGRGSVPERGELDWVQNLFEGNFPDHLQLPHLYPTPEGGIQAEWTIGTTEITLEIDPKDKSGDWHEYDIESGNDHSEALELADSGAIGWLVNRIGQLQREN